MEFALTYTGTLPPRQRRVSREKAALRAAFGPQLAELVPEFYPDGLQGWVAKLDATAAGGLALDNDFLVTEFDGRLPHQVHLDGGDASSDSYCFP